MALVAALLLALGEGPAAAEGKVVRFVTEPAGTSLTFAPPPPSFEGKVEAPGGTRAAGAVTVPHSGPVAAATGDVFLQDGAETSLALSSGDGNVLVASYNAGWDFEPDVPHASSTDGNVSWTSRTFPNGTDTFVGYPFDPWVVAGNNPGEFFSTFIRRDSAGSGNARTIVSRSIDGGASFSLFFERTKDVFQDREMVDVDRTSALGGGNGSVYDGRLYLAYDDFGAAQAGYVGSFLQVLSPTGEPVMELQVSGTGSPPFRGSQVQPVSGVTDGVVYLLATAIGGSPSGATSLAHFHLLTNGGTGPNTFFVSTLSWPAAGQRLGSTTRFGLNGHRIDNHGTLAIDRSSGPRRGTLFFVSNRNPNPSDPSRDQGDVFLSVSADGAASWLSAAIPTASDKTQFFPMLEVDAQGVLHVAYYQNETGVSDGGVLHASTANLYYTNSIDGGTTWSVPVRVNDDTNTLDLEDPPPDRSEDRYYLIGDYAQLRATGSDSATKVYVLWTGYDEDRSDAVLGDRKARVLCTTVEGVLGGPSCPLDVDGSGAPPDVATDLTYVARRTLGLSPAPSSFRAADPTIPDDALLAERIDALGTGLDVDGDGIVSVATDITYVSRRLLGLDPVPPAFRPGHPEIPPSEEISALVDALCP